MSQPPGRPSEDVEQHCYRHPKREALIRCTRCDRPICPDCMRPASVGFHCPDDVAAGARAVRTPRTAVGARLLQAPPYVTIAIVALNVIAYLLTATQKPGTLRDPTGSQLFRDLNLYPYAVRNQHDYYQLLTSAFLHLSPLHIAANMITLAMIGPTLEPVLGRWRFLTTYVLSALGGSAAVYAFGNEFDFTAGASGAIFGLFGVCLVLVRKLNVNAQWLVGVLVVNFVVTFAVPNISKYGHIGGFVTGLLVGLAIGGLPTVQRRVEPRLQVAGLAGVLVLVAVVVGVRTATW